MFSHVDKRTFFGSKVKLSIALVILSIILTVLLFTFWYDSSQHQQYSIIIDAGSSHSAAFLYRWSPLDGGKTAKQIAVCQIERALLSPSDSQTIEKLVNCTERLIGSLNGSESSPTVTLYLAATAGMRLQELTNPHSTERLFKIIQYRFENMNMKCKLEVKFVDTITGKDVGVFAWIAANHAANRLNGTAGGKVGILEMGDASVQFAQEERYSSERSRQILLFGHNYSVDSTSDLCLGVNEAFGRYLLRKQEQLPSRNHLSIACLPVGVNVSLSQFLATTKSPCLQSANGKAPFLTNTASIMVRGTGDFATCSSEIQSLLLTDCTFKYCYEIHKEKKTANVYYALATFAKLANTFQLASPLSNDAWIQMGKDICSNFTCWQLDKYQVKGHQSAQKNCFKMALAEQVLTNVYNFNRQNWTSQLRFEEVINGTALNWPLGMTIREASKCPSTSN